MDTKSKILLIGCSCLIGVAAFTVATNYSDHDELIAEYKTTTDGSYYTKHLRVNEDGSLSVVDENGEYVTTLVGQPEDFDVDKWEAFFKASDLSETRRKIVLEALDCKRKGVIYHQLRPGAGVPGRCLCGCSAEKGATFYPGYENNYDFATQAAYNIEDPLYLDCSYFVKHCLWAGGIETSCTTTSMLYSSGEFVTIPKEQLLPGDFAVKNGHTVLFIAFTADNTPIWIELMGHADDCVFSAYEQSGAYIYRRHTSLANDTTFTPAKTSPMQSGGGSGSGNTSNAQPGVNETSWDDSWEFAQSEMKHPDKLNKYVPDNWNGKTVFLNPGHGDGNSLSSVIPNDPLGGLQNQYSGNASAGHTCGTNYITSAGKNVIEAQYVLDVCMKAKDMLLDKGYAVIMSRESLVNNFENSARSIWANNTSDIHVAVHIDSGVNGPGWYRGDTAQQQHANASRWYVQGSKLGEAIEQACARTLNLSVCTSRAGKLTGYCYSTIPCAYIELFGVESTTMADFADTHINEAAQGLAEGIDAYFGGQ